jgi:hypothetical protein
MIVFFAVRAIPQGSSDQITTLSVCAFFCPIEDFQVGKIKGASAVKLLRPLLIEP